MKPSVLFLDHGLNAGGAERVMCTIMRSLGPCDVDAHLVLVDRLGALSHLVPAHVVVHELGSRHTSSALWPLVRKLWEVRPTVVFSTTEHVSLLAILAKPLSPRFRTVARCPIMPSLAVREGAAGFVGWRGALLKAIYRRADIVVGQTEEMAAELASVLRVPSRKIRTIPNPIDMAHVSASLENASDPYAACGSGEKIVAVGTVTPRKAFDVLLRAFAALRRLRPAATLFIVGRDSDGHRGELEALANELGIAGGVVFTGYCANPYPFMRFADLFVLSSRAEGLPNALLEARVLGCRAVAVECLPVISRIMDGRYLVPIDDHERLSTEMHKALGEPPLRALQPEGTEAFKRLLIED